MEDCNLMAADAIVISCCCPCLILQIIVFVLLKVPYKLVMKSKIVVLKRLSGKIRKRREKTRWREVDQQRLGGQKTRSERDLTRILVDKKGVHEDLSSYHDCGWVVMEVEKVLEEVSQKGEFAFGSFWGREESSNSSLSPDIGKVEFDDIVQYQLIEIVKPLQTTA